MEKQLKHLEMIQGVINRLSTNSFLLKGWSVILVSALFALAASNKEPLIVGLAFLPAFAFWVLDGYFLWQERLFRRLYDTVREKDEKDINFDMKTPKKDKEITWLKATCSETLNLFHGAISLTILLTLIFLTYSG